MGPFTQLGAARAGGEPAAAPEKHPSNLTRIMPA